MCLGQVYGISKFLLLNLIYTPPHPPHTDWGKGVTGDNS